MRSADQIHTKDCRCARCLEFEIRLRDIVIEEFAKATSSIVQAHVLEQAEATFAKACDCSRLPPSVPRSISNEDQRKIVQRVLRELE